MQLSEPQLIEVSLPTCISIEIRKGKNRARQFLEYGEKAWLNLDVNPLIITRKDGSLAQSAQRYLQIQPRGLQHPSLVPFDSQVSWVGDLSSESPSGVRETWKESINFILGDKETGQAGLRLPQLGALHSVLGYWTTGSTQPVSVVMPTGTGKTETMIALLVAAQIERLLVIVPSDVLRTQISRKFETFGVLQRDGVIAQKAHRPVVGQLKQAFEFSEDAREFCEMCNVIVATPSALFASSQEVMTKILDCCSHLIIDEAHHVEANTWRKLRDTFSDRPVVQFTATPFREDGRRVAGQIIYSFPLKQAQKNNYFSHINYIPVLNLEDPDRAIAQAAILQLRNDLLVGFDHILMARVKRIGRAEEIKEIYEEFAPDLSPVILHSTLPVQTKYSALDAIRNRRS